MAAAHRGRKAAYGRRRKWQRQAWAPKIRTRRKKLQSRQRRKTRNQRAVRFARSRYRARRNTATRYFDRRLRASVLSRYKTRYPARSYSRRASRRKPRRVGRPRKDRRRRGVNSRSLHTTLKKSGRKKQANFPGSAVPQKSRRKTRKNEDEIFYSMANTSTLDGTPEDRQSKKHSVHFANNANSRAKESDLHLQDDSADNQPSQQPVVPKKRSRHSATPVQKSR